MKFVFTSRHFKAHDTLKEFAEKESEKLNKFFDGIMKCEVILSFEKPTNSIKIAEVIIDTSTHNIITAKADSDDFKISIERSLEKAEKQIKKLKSKIKTNHNQSHRYDEPVTE